jgi:choline monooxygenase
VTFTLPARAYVDGATYERERHAVFARQWQLAALRVQLREPGDYCAHDFAGWRVLVIVQDDGSLRAFHNVCRHRAGPLVHDDRGHCTNLICRYHGWSYTRDGRLHSARDFGDDDLDPGELSLYPVGVDEWRGLVFVNLDPDARSLATDHAAFFDAASDQPLDEFTYSHRLVHQVDANWKVYADNYMEGYHVPLVHPELNREILAKDYRVHVGDHFCEHTVPTRDGAVNAGRWLWRYPNLALNVYPGGMNVERFVPVDHRTTTVIYDYFFRDPSARAGNEEVVRIGRTILDEDRVICETVQRNLESGIYDRGRLSPRHENGVHAFQQWVTESLERGHA